MSGATRAEVCAVACAEAWRGDGEIVASPFGVIPTIGARLARATFAPDLLLSDGEATFVAGSWAVGEPPDGPAEGWVPFRAVFDILAAGKRHVMMGPSQIDRFGNVNISAIGDFARPARQLIGVRGAPGNTVNHPTSYWVPRHQPRDVRAEGRRRLGGRLRQRGGGGARRQPVPRAAAGRHEPGGARLPLARPRDAARFRASRRQRGRGRRQHRLRPGDRRRRAADQDADSRGAPAHPRRHRPPRHPATGRCR